MLALNYTKSIIMTPPRTHLCTYSIIVNRWRKYTTISLNSEKPELEKRNPEKVELYKLYVLRERKTFEIVYVTHSEQRGTQSSSSSFIKCPPSSS